MSNNSETKSDRRKERHMDLLILIEGEWKRIGTGRATDRNSPNLGSFYAIVAKLDEPRTFEKGQKIGLAPIGSPSPRQQFTVLEHAEPKARSKEVRINCTKS